MMQPATTTVPPQYHQQPPQQPSQQWMPHPAPYQVPPRSSRPPSDTINSNRRLRHPPSRRNSTPRRRRLRLSRYLMTASGACGSEICNTGWTNSINTAPFRDWVVLKGSNYGGGPYRAWYCTQAGGLDNGGGELGTENEEGDDDENAKGKVQRRQRSGGVGGGAAVAGNPDLLTIPGVGPRNLRKLVEKGIEGMAQLKQLYKDKV